MRLIDADALFEQYNLKDATKYGNKNAEQQAHSYSTMMLYEISDMIEDAPTAYDVDKVVEQLEDERELSYADFDRYVDEVSPCLDAEYDDFFHRGLERAIKIVKGGGVDADGI